MSGLDVFWFLVFPYVATGIFFVGVTYRIRQKGFQVSALSSQFLEGKKLFWGAVPFHIGILVLFIGHLVAFLLPSVILGWNADPVRLLILEGTALVFGLSVLFSLIGLIGRRLQSHRISVVTTGMDLFVEFLLLGQVILGVWVATQYRWGSSWFAADLSPYLWSIVTFQPDATAVAAMPLPVQLHIIGAFLILLMVPFSRLVHFLVAPFHYISRPYQVVRWNWDPKKVRDPKTAWSIHRPKNN